MTDFVTIEGSDVPVPVTGTDRHTYDLQSRFDRMCEMCRSTCVGRVVADQVYCDWWNRRQMTIGSSHGYVLQIGDIVTSVLWWRSLALNLIRAFAYWYSVGDVVAARQVMGVVLADDEHTRAYYEGMIVFLDHWMENV